MFNRASSKSGTIFCHALCEFLYALSLLTLCSLAQASDAKVQLGQMIFNDRSLSVDGTISCGSCHQADKKFTDGLAVARGIAGQLGTRNTPSLAALPYSEFFWDGRAASLEDLVLQPFINAREMGLRDQAELLSRLKASGRYRKAFATAFAGEPILKDQTQPSRALAAFVRSISAIRPRVAALKQAANDPEASAVDAGLELFSGRAGCSSCHQLGPSAWPLTDGQYHQTPMAPGNSVELAPAAADLLRTTGDAVDLGNRIAGNRDLAGLGRFAITRKPADIGSFRTPTLWNVALTAPYMHDGRVKTLPEAVDEEIYYRAPKTAGTLTPQDRAQLVQFIGSLKN